MDNWPFTNAAPSLPRLMAFEGFPISGDAIREFTHDDSPTPFRMGDVLWPLLRGE